MTKLELSQLIIRKYFIFIFAGLIIILVVISIILAQTGNNSSKTTNNTTNNTNPYYPTEKYTKAAYNSNQINNIIKEFINDIGTYQASDPSAYMDEPGIESYVDSSVIQSVRSQVLPKFGGQVNTSIAITNQNIDYAYNSTIHAKVNADYVVTQISTGSTVGYKLEYDITLVNKNNNWIVGNYSETVLK